MVGGIDYSKSQYNIAVDSHRQPGSTFKPIVYTAAINDGHITDRSTIHDSPIDLPGANGSRWKPHNDDDRYHGSVTAIDAMAQSYNIPAIKVLKLEGPFNAIAYANAMGVNSDLDAVLPLAIGASAVTPLEMSVAYATINNDGLRPSPTCVKQITDQKGNVLYTAEPVLATTFIRKSTTTQLKEMLRAVVTYGTASRILGDDAVRGACGKTGTTQQHYDVWFDGFASDLVCIVWAGHPSYSANGRANYGVPLHEGAFGATICTPIWKKYMMGAIPILQAQRAKEAAAKKPVVVATPAPRVNSDSGDNDSDDNDDSRDNSQDKHDIDKNTIWVDNDTGAQVSPNSPNSHIVHVHPAAPSPQPTNSDTPDSDTAPDSTDSTDADTSTKAKPAAGATKNVTVEICTDSGMLATKWCPSRIERTYAAGSEPKKKCTMHQPPPGEQ